MKIKADQQKQMAFFCSSPHRIRPVQLCTDGLQWGNIIMNTPDRNMTLQCFVNLFSHENWMPSVPCPHFTNVIQTDETNHHSTVVEEVGLSH